MNVVCVTGRLTADPELKKTTNGVSAANITVAVRRPMAKDATDFFDVVLWRQNAEYLCQFGRKGSIVEITGNLISNKWEDKNGSKRVSISISTNRIELRENKDIHTDTSVDSSEDEGLPF